MERFVYVIYLGATAEELWQALKDGELIHQFWSDHRLAPDWQVGPPAEV